MTDMTIEQTLMRSFKVKGGLTQGGRINDTSQRKWTLGAAYMQDVCQKVEEFAGIITGTSEQHIDSRQSRVSRDNSNAEKLSVWFNTHDPFPETKYFMSISTGVVGSEIVNCHRAFEIGMEMMKKINGSTYDSLSFKRKDKILALAAINSSLNIHSVSVAVNPLLLFQRISLSKQSDEDLKNVLNYELSPFPLSLFTEEGMRKGTKSSFYTSFAPLSDTPQFGTKRLDVIDGGFLLHRVIWDSHSNFGTTCKKYVTYVRRRFAKDIVVVFDGYAEDPHFAGTKESERLRRARKQQSSDIIFDENTVPTVSQEKFLSNGKNKARFINMLMKHLQLSDVTVEQAFEDADTLIVKTAIENASLYDSVTIIGEDIDLLVLLTGLGQETPNVFLRKPGKGKTQEALYSAKSFKHSSIIDHIFLLHVFTGCDTTSAIYNIGKTKLINILEKNDGLREVLGMFKKMKLDIDVLTAAGEKIFFLLFGGTGEVSLNSLRYKQFVKLVNKTKFNLSSLPPTAAAAKQHTFHAYHQVQTWLDIHKDPEEWGWRRTPVGLQPIMTTQDPAPPTILESISCKCKRKCGAACGCRKAGLKCSVICKHCSGESCTNIAQLQVLQDDDDCDEFPPVD
ncbi:PREDICTED: uncharacterized protein LOC105557068, partial [Vollenhovia emeryi]|uniref:uncharacterized protein LOC105557068 n=1 Tax=Vollenhovia emeryi TaxID=411798 RepID=UPI0005F4559B